MNCYPCSLASRSPTNGGFGLGVPPAVALCRGCGAGLCPDHLVSNEIILCSACAERTKRGSAHVE